MSRSRILAVWAALCVLIVFALSSQQLACTLNGTGGARPLPPVPTGGALSTGGSSALATGGSAPVATGGTSSAPLVWPACDRELRNKAAVPKPVKRQLNLRRSVRHLTMGAPLRAPARSISVMWDPVFPLDPAPDQGTFSDCAAEGALTTWATLPFNGRFCDSIGGQVLARSVYSDATKIDPWPDNTYPPKDTGTDLDSVARIMVERGMWRAWQPADTLPEALAALDSGAIECGFDWYQVDMDPGCEGVLKTEGDLAGRHATAIVGKDYEHQLVIGSNSWGNRWGACRGIRCGYYKLSFAQFDMLLKDGGQCNAPSP